MIPNLTRTSKLFLGVQPHVKCVQLVLSICVRGICSSSSSPFFPYFLFFFNIFAFSCCLSHFLLSFFSLCSTVVINERGRFILNMRGVLRDSLLILHHYVLRLIFHVRVSIRTPSFWVPSLASLLFA